MPQLIDSSWGKYALAGGSALGGALANRGGTSTTSPTMAPEYKPLQNSLIDRLMKRLNDPTGGLESQRYNALDQVNSGYSGLPNRVGTQLAKRGMGQSGQMGAALKGIDISRMRDLSSTGASYDKMALDEQDRTMQMIEQVLGLGRGNTSTTSGNMLGGGVGAGLETLSTLTMLDKMLKGTPAAAGISAAGLVPGAPTGLAAGGAGVGSGASGGGAAGAGGASSLLSSLIGPGLMAAMVPIGGPNSDSLIAKGVNAWGDFLGSKFPDWMRGADPDGKNWENYTYLLSNQPGGQVPTEEGFKAYMDAVNYYNATGQWPPDYTGPKG